MRLDQVETQSSWHSGGTCMRGVEQSPVSFAPVGHGEPMDGNRRVKALTEGLPMGERHGLGVTEQNECGSGAIGPEGTLVPVGCRG